MACLISPVCSGNCAARVRQAVLQRCTITDVCASICTIDRDSKCAAAAAAAASTAYMAAAECRCVTHAVYQDRFVVLVCQPKL
jgi:hypothetical protein